MSTSTRGIDLSDLHYSISQTRTKFTRLRGHNRRLDQNEQQPDFITLICLICRIYQYSGDQLAPIQQFHPSREQQYNQGHTSTISHIKLPRNGESAGQGKSIGPPEYLIVKRPRQSILEPQSSALLSFITELRIRMHDPLRAHQSIAKFRGVGWDFEDEEATIPRPLLLEELAPQGSLDNFWVKWSFVKLTFKSKLDLCRDVAEGLLALHRCGVVHGDVKPDNVLVFPRENVNNSFRAKLTDFGHSVFEHSRLDTVPAFTPFWCAPEVETAVNMSFSEMKATDSYSYGLVVLSIMIARVFHTDLQGAKEHKQNGTLLHEAIRLVEKEDRENNNADFDIGVIRSLLEQTVRLEPRDRNLHSCVAVMKKYDTIHRHESEYTRVFSGSRSEKVPPLKVDEMIAIGYQSLGRCSYQLKEHITTKLTAIATDGKDPRRMAAAWELAICHFSGFGVPVSFPECSAWLSMAMRGGVVAANSFYHVLYQAMDIPVDPSCINTLPPAITTQKEANTLLKEQKVPYQVESKFQALKGDSADEGGEGGGGGGPSDDNLEDRSTPTEPTQILNGISDIIQQGSIVELQKYLRDEPGLLNGRDSQGNSPLLLAAKSQREDMLGTLISYDDLDASVLDGSGRTVLHFLPSFNETTAQSWVQQLCKRRADIHHEALPSRGEGDTLSFSSGIRCCSILNAILHGKLGLLRVLLEACHTAENSVPCRICEAGSAFRRIIAICLSIFRADAAELLLAHREKNGASRKIEVNQIEVWVGHDLLPLNTIPFNSIAVKAMDLPESFFRAINFGDQYNRMLEQTLTFLLPVTDNIEQVCYSMLQQAARKDCIPAAQLLIRLGERRAFHKHWWIRTPIEESPFMESIRVGSRELFNFFCKEWPDILLKKTATPCGCDEARPPFYVRLKLALLGRPNEWKDVLHTHDRENVGFTLSTFARASHADRFFLDAILKRTQKDLVVGSSATSMADSVLSSNFSLAASLSAYAPELWSQPFKRHYSLPIMAFMARGGSIELLRTAAAHSVVASVFVIGSYEQCQFMMQKLLPVRGSDRVLRSRLQWIKAKVHSTEYAAPEWTRCNLSKKEFSYLAMGNILGPRPDRELIWGIVQEQIAQGHKASISGLISSIRYGNPDALDQMLSSGWSVNTLVSRYFDNPLLEIQRLRKHVQSHWEYSDFLRALERLHPELPQGEWEEGATHAIIYDQFNKWKAEQGRAEWSARLQKCEDILSAHGVELPLLVTAWHRAKERIIAWAAIFYILLYAVVLPFVLVYGTKSTWTAWSTGEKFAFAYLWSIVAIAAPPPLWLWTRNYRTYLTYSWILSFLVDHVAILVLVLRFDWRPFQTCQTIPGEGISTTICTNYSYLLPLAVGTVEVLLSFAVVGIQEVHPELRHYFRRYW